MFMRSVGKKKSHMLIEHPWYAKHWKTLCFCCRCGRSIFFLNGNSFLPRKPEGAVSDRLPLPLPLSTFLSISPSFSFLSLFFSLHPPHSHFPLIPLSNPTYHYILIRFPTRAPTGSLHNFNSLHKFPSCTCLWPHMNLQYNVPLTTKIPDSLQIWLQWTYILYPRYLIIPSDSLGTLTVVTHHKDPGHGQSLTKQRDPYCRE